MSLQKKRGQYTVSSLCKRLGNALINERNNEIEQIWSYITRSTPLFKEVISRAEHAGASSIVIKISDLKNIIISLSKHKNKNSKHAFDSYALTVIHILENAKVISNVDRKTVKLHKLNSSDNFISQELIEQFKSIKIRKFNLVRLLHYCEQINENYRLGYYESIVFVTRALMDHVPPIFGQPNFESIGSQVKQGKVSSFKKSCDKLNSSLKHIADDLIHKQISAGVSLLVKEEIDFSQDLNTFLRRTLEELQSIQSQEQ